MRRASLLASACVADALFGDPVWFPHPVRGIGAAIALGERLARRYARGEPRRERLAGYALCASIVLGTYGGAVLLRTLARRIDERAGDAVEIALGWTALAARDLLAEAGPVAAALEARELALARTRVARIVGRETAELDASEVARAAIETLAESTCDGIIAPLLAIAMGGAPLALAFKAASTLDSMIGHVEPPYTHLGYASAKLDDLACWIPARIAAAALACVAPVAGGNARRAFATLRVDGGKHRSPNAGRPEAAMAGALGVRLGGTNRYDGTPHAAPLLGAAFAAPVSQDVRRAMWLVAASASLVAIATTAAATRFRAIE